MKKSLSVFLLLGFFVSHGFTNSYEETLSKAKVYEENHQWVYALGYYYDAAHMAPTEEEARLKYKAIKKGFDSGLIGLDPISDNPFDSLDQWTSLRNEFQKYFTENPTFDFHFSDFKNLTLNNSDKTGNCEVFIYFTTSQKFLELKNIIQKHLPENINLFKADFDYSKYSTIEKSEINLYSELYEIMEDGLKNYYKETGIPMSDNV